MTNTSHSLSQRTTSTCEVCGATTLLPVLSLGAHPLCDDLIPLGSDAECPRHHIEILFCSDCATAHQCYPIAKEELFPPTYHYRSRLTADVLDGMDDLVCCVAAIAGGLSGKVVLDVGCNDGSLLDRFADHGAHTLGVEPTYAALDANPARHIIFKDFFSRSSAEAIRRHSPHIDVITFTNSFAHIEDLPALLTNISLLMSEHTLLVIENHYLGAILATRQFDTFYLEHPRTYSLTSFTYIARSLNRRLLDVSFPRRYGGNIRVFIGSASANPTRDPLTHLRNILMQESRSQEQFAALRGFISSWQLEKHAELRRLADKYGPLPAKAFPGRAAILLSMLGLDEHILRCVYEKPQSPKIGHYVPGTRIPIVSDAELFSKDRDAPVLLNLAWHIPDEIVAYLRHHGYSGDVLHIL